MPITDDVIKIASGFPIGMGGSGCVCGAVIGGVMALGLFFWQKRAQRPEGQQSDGLQRIARHL